LRFNMNDEKELWMTKLTAEWPPTLCPHGKTPTERVRGLRHLAANFEIVP